MNTGILGQIEGMRTLQHYERDIEIGNCKTMTDRHGKDTEKGGQYSTRIEKLTEGTK